MLVRFLLLLATALALFCVPAHARPLAEVQRSGELVVGTDATYPPFETVNIRGKYEGFDIDLGEEIGKDLGVRVRWINSSFDGIFAALQAGKFDLIMSTVIITPQRLKTMAMSDPYYDSGQVIAVRKGRPKLTPEDLPGRTVGVQINTTAQFTLEKDRRIKVRKYPDIASAMLDLQNDRLDAIVNDAPTTQYMILRTFRDLEVAGKPFTVDQYAICARPEDKDLLAAVNAALARIKADGRHARIHEKWFGSASEAEQAPAPLPAAEGHLERLLAALPILYVEGVTNTLVLTGLALLFGIPIGLVVGLARLVPNRAVSTVSAVFVEATRGTPLLVQIFTIYFVLPAIGIRLPAFPAAVIALSLNAGAYISEIFRAGIQSIHKGQMEAARSLGYSWLGAMLDVIVPQALRRIVPPLSNEAISLLKDSSLVMVIGMTELTRRGQEIASVTGDPLAIWPAVGICYLSMTLPLTFLARYLERRWAY